MKEITIEVEGMRCGMCESHVNDAVRKACEVKKVNSSRHKKQTVIIAEDDFDANVAVRAIAEQGYDTGKVTVKPYEKHGLFHFKK